MRLTSRGWWRASGLLAVIVVSGWLVGRTHAEDAPAPPPPPAVPSPGGAPAGTCLACHGDPAKAGGHLVDGEKAGRSVHKDMGCTDCHEGFEVHPHPKDTKSETCVGCHEDAAKALGKSVHAPAATPGPEGSRAAGCVDCHGVHDVFRSKDRESRLHPLNGPATCLACHEGHAGAEGATQPGMPPRVSYTDGVHAHALLKSGLTVAPSCITCHGGHDILHSSDPASRVHMAKAADLCGSCHVGVVEQYRTSVHGMVPRDATKTSNHREPATCIDCHHPHRTRRASSRDFKLEIIETCGGCHEDYLRTYRGTYHGRVTHIGFEQVATCDGCHTPHRILPTANPDSSVHPSHRTATCAACHPGATDRFATYPVHADPRDRERYPGLWWADHIMSGVILVVWCLAGLHILLWFVRATIERKNVVAHAEQATGRWYERLRPAYRVLHLILVFSFLTLALTGLPLRFHDAAWSAKIYALLGGPESVRFLHRFAGVVTFGYFFGYVTHLVRRWRRGDKAILKPWNSMLFRWKDAQDIAGNFRWFLFGGKPPKFDRWTYWEKFDFWAEVWGVGFIGLTGLLMWFPITSTSILPPWIVALAHILHSYEALLATSFIFTVHFFHANLRPGKFPLDPVFLTGRISEEELRHERPEQYERMKREGRLESEALPPPDRALVRRAYILGSILLTIGLGLLVLMVISMVTQGGT